jgi:hypothetical protein
MPSSGYVANSFTAGQQPTTTIWNELWANDASFNSGAGFNDGIIIARHFATGAVTAPAIGTNAVLSTALGLSHAIDPTNGVQSQTNTGGAGGTMYYINLGGLKILWGQTAGIVATAAGPQYTVTFPASFFSTIQTATVSVNSLNTVSNQNPNWITISATTGNIIAYAASTTTAQIYGYCIIGT